MLPDNKIWYYIIKLSIINLFFLLFLLYIFFYSEKTFIKGAKAKLGPKKFRFWNNVVKIMAVILLAIEGYYSSIPFTLDVIHFSKDGAKWNNVEYLKGQVSVCHRTPIAWCLHQSVTMKSINNNYYLLLSNNLVRNDKNYEFYYLKHSRLILWINRLPDGPVDPFNSEHAYSMKGPQ